MNKDELKKFVEDNPKLVTMKESKSYPGLFVLKYTRRVFYDALWNDFLEECRGTVIDADFNVISRPFTKIYNFRVEDKAPVLADDVKITTYRKVNGFMVAMTLYNGEVLVSTTGSLDSDFVDMAKEMMLQENTWDSWKTALQASKGYTLMFECVHPNDPHIVPETAGMYFLGWRENTWESKVNGYGVEVSDHWRKFAFSVLRCKYAESTETTVGELVALSKTVKHEGFVFYTEDGTSAKIKSPYYLVSKFVARNPRTDKLMRKDIKQSMDEEYYPLLDAIQENIEWYTLLDEQARLSWVRSILEAQ